ncbi:Transporter [Pseudomonas amygdali pv. morsprunorum]|nr:Transporter [Pseudomonas amygdali pv. morsprunorum]
MTSIWRTSGWVLLGSALILALSLGTRHGFGLFLAPMSADFGWGREVFAFAIALQNLMWGLAQPFAGALADRFGAAKVVFVVLCMSMADSSLSLSLSAGLVCPARLFRSFWVSWGVRCLRKNAAWAWVSPARRVHSASSPCCPAHWA